MGIMASIIESISRQEGVDVRVASDEIKYRIYKLTLIEIQRMLSNDEVARVSLSAIKTALNDVENGFIYLLNRPKVKKGDIRMVMQRLIDARAYSGTALTELRTNGKKFGYHQAIGRCKLLIAEINQQLGP